MEVQMMERYIANAYLQNILEPPPSGGCVRILFLLIIFQYLWLDQHVV